MYAPGSVRAPKAILTPTIDALCIGGLSFFLLAPIFLQDAPVHRADLATEMLILAAAINSPHIVASYLLLYRSPSSVREHPWASLWLPLMLLALCAAAILLQALGVTGALLDAIILVTSVYTPIHFVGQTWGMMALYSAMEGRPFDVVERRILKGSLWLLILWNMSFAMTYHRGWPASLPAAIEPAFATLSLAVPGSLACSATAMYRYRRRTGFLPPCRVLIPWAAIFLWYSMAARQPEAVFLVQICHALQYLPFPLRVEMNRAVAARCAIAPIVRRTIAVLAGGVALFLVLPLLVPLRDLPRTLTVYPGVALGLSSVYLVALVLVARAVPSDGQIARAQALSFAVMSTIGGTFAFWFVHRMLKSLLAFVDIDGELIGVSVMIAMFLNLHHYLTDGVLWKLRNPEVRRDLFAHLPT